MKLEPRPALEATGLLLAFLVGLYLFLLLPKQVVLYTGLVILIGALWSCLYRLRCLKRELTRQPEEPHRHDRL